MKKVFEKQGWHLLALIALLAGTFFIVKTDPDFISGSLWGIETKMWLALSIAIPIIHQAYVMICWRLELHYNYLTDRLGAGAFKKYMVGFFLIFNSRMGFMILLSISNRNTLSISYSISAPITILFFAIAAYTFYSVFRYFGFRKAAGLDHFDPEVQKSPFVKRGAFKYSKNAMYSFAFLIIYIPGLIALSKAALLAAIFSHLYIWVHYYTTELPDIRRMYERTS
ncbi:MAG: hypothetical protein GY751_12315 [Bacteroidetes bacterium]|nr:hypothetical protein [Bacteroidota bacterium]